MKSSYKKPKLPWRATGMRLPGRWYRWIDHRGRISRFEHWLWPELHWCAEQDDLLEETFQPFCSQDCLWLPR